MYKIPAKPLFLGKNLIFMPECHSTNTLALARCHEESISDGTVIITNHQTAGRGQRGNSWQSEQGRNLTFSLIVKTHFINLSDQFFLHIFSSLGVAAYLQQATEADIHVKWPNDIYANGEKIAGILIENQVSGHRLTHSVIGIGLNVNQTSFSLPRVTSLSILRGREHDLSAVLDDLLHCIEQRYFQLKESKYQQLKEDYYSNLYKFGEPHQFQAQGETFEGIVKGIDEHGKLIVERRGMEKTYDLKEIQFA